MTAHEEVGQWVSYPVAFYHSYVELYVGNAFIGKFLPFFLNLLDNESVIRLVICRPHMQGKLSSQQRFSGFDHMIRK
jgi:hypothetical protein